VRIAQFVLFASLKRRDAFNVLGDVAARKPVSTSAGTPDGLPPTNGTKIKARPICTPRQMPWRFDSLHHVSGAHKCRLDAFDRFRTGDAFSGDGVEAKARGEGRQ
jgi:hypothetical protein